MAYLSQFSTYRYVTPLFGILTSRRLKQGVKRRSKPIQSRDIEQNVKVILTFLIARSLILTTFTFCSISLDWIGVGRRFTPCWKHLLVRIPKSGISYLYIKNWLSYAVLKKCIRNYDSSCNYNHPYTPQLRFISD